MTDRQIRPWETAFEVEEIEVLMETLELRVLAITLAPGECVPWHFHPDSDDLFVCIAGPVDVHTKAPAGVTRLTPGARTMVPAKQAHLVHNPSTATIQFLNIQGIGPYDYIPVGDQAHPKFEAAPP